MNKDMSLKGRLTMAVVTIILLPRMESKRSERETSAEYLEKSMIELKVFNGAATAAATSGHEEKDKLMVRPYVRDVDSTNILKRTSSPQSPPHNNRPTLGVDSLGLSRVQLATLYKNALKRGAPISLSALTNALSAGGKIPSIALPSTIDLQRPSDSASPPPAYQYYFFPLKTFAAELGKEYGYKTIPSSVVSLPESLPSDLSQTNKDLYNPLFTAITSFIGMALLFMIGILFLPKLGQLTGINGRAAQEDLFLQLTVNVLEALDKGQLVNAGNKVGAKEAEKSNMDE